MAMDMAMVMAMVMALAMDMAMAMGPWGGRGSHGAHGGSQGPLFHQHFIQFQKNIEIYKQILHIIKNKSF